MRLLNLQTQRRCCRVRPLSGIKIIKGADRYGSINSTRKPRVITFARIAAYTHHQRRSNPEQYGFNVGCLEGVNPFDIPNVPTNDGVNHPADRRAT